MLRPPFFLTGRRPVCCTLCLYGRRDVSGRFVGLTLLTESRGLEPDTDFSEAEERRMGRFTANGEVGGGGSWRELVAGVWDLRVWWFQRLRMRKAGGQEGDLGVRICFVAFVCFVVRCVGQNQRNHETDETHENGATTVAIVYPEESYRIMRRLLRGLHGDGMRLPRAGVSRMS